MEEKETHERRDKKFIEDNKSNIIFTGEYSIKLRECWSDLWKFMLGIK